MVELKNENEKLQRINRQLQMEISALKEAEDNGVIIVRKSVVPKDYEPNKRRLAALEEELENLKYILSFSGIQSLDCMTAELESELRLKMKRIADEFQNFPVGAVERRLIQHTIQHFKEHIKGLEALLK